MTSAKTREYKRLWQKRWRETHPTEQRILAKRYSRNRLLNHREEYLKTINKGVLNWRKRNPEKNMAHRKVFVAVRNGTLIKEPCFCGNVKSEAHHEDYSKPLEVQWLCKIHHILADKKRRLST